MGSAWSHAYWEWEAPWYWHPISKLCLMNSGVNISPKEERASQRKRRGLGRNNSRCPHAAIDLPLTCCGGMCWAHLWDHPAQCSIPFCSGSGSGSLCKFCSSAAGVRGKRHDCGQRQSRRSSWRWAFRWAGKAEWLYMEREKEGGYFAGWGASWGKHARYDCGAKFLLGFFFKCKYLCKGYHVNWSIYSPELAYSRTASWSSTRIWGNEALDR